MHLGVIVDSNREDEERVDLKHLVEKIDAAGHLVDWDDDILHHMLVDDVSSDLRGHAELEEGHLWCSEPSQSVAVEWVVAERNQVSQLPTKHRTLLHEWRHLQ